MTIERANSAILVPGNRASVGMCKRPDGTRSIAIAFHDPDFGIRLHPLTVEEARRFRDALGRAIEIMGSS